MGLDLTGFGSVFEFGGKVLDKIFPDKEAAERAKLELLKMQQAGEFRELEERMASIRAEATSTDPWTSRARPSFMYVMYLMILSAIPMGFLFALKPELAMAATAGTKAWLAAIPEQMWWLFGVGYTGYTATRGYEKTRCVTK